MPSLDCSISLRSASRRPFSPVVESLEIRITPTDFSWNPAVIDGQIGLRWSAPANWYSKDINGDYQPQNIAIPGVGDKVVFPDNSPGLFTPAIQSSRCYVDVAGGVTVSDVKISGSYNLVLTNNLTVSGGQMSCFIYSAIRADLRNNPAARGILTLTNGAELDWRRGYFADLDINVVNSSSMSVYALGYANSGGPNYNHDMNNTNINIASGSKLTWTNGDVKVENPLANSHLTIASGAQFLIEASGGTWGMTDYRDPAYFGVHNRGTVTVNATGRATILGNYDSTSLTRIESGDLLIYGLAEQTRGSFELRNNSMVTVGPPDMALRIYGGTIVGTGTVNANLTLGLLGGGQSQGYISPGIDTIPASPGAAPNVYGIGKITVVGSFHIFNGGMTVDYDATGNYDKVVVQGTYGALKGSLFVRGDNNYKPAQPVTMAFLTAALFYDDFSPPTSSGIAFWMAPNGMDTNTFRIKKYATSYVIETYTIISPH